MGVAPPDDQQAVLDAWLPGAVVVADRSWSLGLRYVLSLEHDASSMP